MKIHLKALGCRLNEAELEQWSKEFRRNGHGITMQADEADVVIVNTCAVTQDATRKSRKLMNRLHRENPQSKLVVSGCYATLEQDEVANRLGVDLVVNNREKDNLPVKVIEKFSANTMPAIAMEPGESSLFLRGRQRAFIKVQDGCRYRCTFCIVTVARGEEKSRSLPDIINQVNDLHRQGIQEIVLTGVHVGGYGSDINSSLFELVSKLIEYTDIPRIRFASVEPWDLPESFFELFHNPRLMPHMHLPLQSGSDSVLRRMSRRCKTTDFSNLVQQARDAISDFNVTSDIIVGFPGETEDEWLQTLEAVESIGFGHLHIFSYSPREGTKAAGLPNQVPEDISRRRSRELHVLASKMKRKMQERQINRHVDVLWEGQKSADNGLVRYTGYTPNYLKIETLVSNDVLLDSKITNTQISGLSDLSGNLQGVQI